MSFNLFILSGKIVEDPYYQMKERKNGEGQYEQASYTIVNTQRAREGGVTEAFFDIDVFGQNAKDAKEYLRQGSDVMVRGILKSNSYTSRRGETMNNPVLSVFEQESPDIPENEQTGTLSGPEASHELPERSGRPADGSFDYGEQEYFQ